MLYITNTPVIDTDYCELNINLKLISIDEARHIISQTNQFRSAVGHQSTAEFLSALLHTSIQTNRIAIKLVPSDKIIALKLEGRLQEGRILQSNEIRTIPFRLFLITVSE